MQLTEQLAPTMKHHSSVFLIIPNELFRLKFSASCQALRGFILPLIIVKFSQLHMLSSSFRCLQGKDLVQESFQNFFMQPGASSEIMSTIPFSGFSRQLDDLFRFCPVLSVHNFCIPRCMKHNLK